MKFLLQLIRFLVCMPFMVIGFIGGGIIGCLIFGAKCWDRSDDWLGKG